ncbi:MAG: SH3 domain-containing protein [Nitrospirae bacterium]|nr:SH3 domain-containing protein [Nitrospirota bacterium]
MDEHISKTNEPELNKKEKKTSKKIVKSKVKDKTGIEKGLLLLELAEIKEISDRIFERIEKKIEVLKALEASVDEKINALRKIGQEKPSETPSDETDQRNNIVLSLKQRGLGIEEISSILKIPKGEVELILNLHKSSEDTNVVSKIQRDKKILIQKPQGVKYQYKNIFRKLLWFVPFFAIIVIVYITFIQRDNNRTFLTPQGSEQTLTAQQTLSPEEERTKEIELIREKYNVLSGLTESKEPTKYVLKKKESQVQKEEISKPENIELTGDKKTVIVVTKSATIRTDHSLNSEPLTWVSQGVILEVKDEFIDEANKKWYKILTSDGKEGWIAEKVVKQP